MVLLIVDLALAAARPHRVGFREATAWWVFSIAIATGFRIWFGGLRDHRGALHRLQRERLRAAGAAGALLSGQGLLDRLVYLSTGLSLILGFIGVKLILHRAHVDADPRLPEIPTLLSLGVIVAVLLVVVVASLIKSRRSPATTAHAGSLHGTRPDDRARSTS